MNNYVRELAEEFQSFNAIIVPALMYANYGDYVISEEGQEIRLNEHVHTSYTVRREAGDEDWNYTVPAIRAIRQFVRSAIIGTASAMLADQSLMRTGVGRTHTDYGVNYCLNLRIHANSRFPMHHRIVSIGGIAYSVIRATYSTQGWAVLLDRPLDSGVPGGTMVYTGEQRVALRASCTRGGLLVASPPMPLPNGSGISAAGYEYGGINLRRCNQIHRNGTLVTVDGLFGFKINPRLWERDDNGQ